MGKTLKYIGNELYQFKNAINWKKYWFSFISDFAEGKILYVGSGIGSNANLFFFNKDVELTLLEPDSDLMNYCSKNLKISQIRNLRFINGTIFDLDDNEQFDLILYLDVLEHIEKDQEEIFAAIKHLKSGAKIIILAPAYNFLYSKFDSSVGHYRRYNRKSIRDLYKTSLVDMVESKIIFLDCLGIIASLLNKYILRQTYPNKVQIVFWDRILIRISKFLDFCSFYKIGKSLLAIYTKL